ncbi:6001_t:CDS:10 [Funneliformis geosporum]|uniref:6001_t:CDS:1 n=1 Tax=Funneliformis geosporum TaxID=1117311 RepID=A0A9W4WR35_9GLOM|nr:6001_t:CDS:10 [Funneliformis geosporum]
MCSCLSLLKNYSLLTIDEIAFYADEVKKLCGTLEKGQEINRQFKPIFSISVTSIIDDVENEDGPYLAVELTNNLSISFTFDQLAIRLVSGQSEEIWFGVCNEEIKPGLNSYKLYSDNSASGNYYVENVRMSIGKVSFTHNFLNESKKKSFRINEHPSVLRAQIIAPSEIHIGAQQYFLVRIFTGLSCVNEGKLSLEAISEELSFPKSEKYPSVTKSVINEKISEGIESEQDLEVSEDGKIRIPSFQPNQLIEFQIPYDGNWRSVEHKVRISVEYKSKGKQKAFTSVDTVKVGLPISVNELNIFRDDCLFLKMDITLQGTVPVRILKTDLVPSKVYEVANDPSLSLPSLNLFGKQHASYVYKLTRSKDYDHGEHVKSASTQIHFVVTYRSLQDEVERYVEHTLNTILKSKKLFQHSQFLIENAKEHLLKSVDYVSYGMTDILDLGELDIAQCENLFVTHGAAKDALINVVKEFWEILNTVELIISKSHDLIVGEPCHCRLIIRHSSYWNYTSTDTLEFYYDVHVDFDNWLLAGHKKLCFSSKAGETNEFPITLVPLKTGHLLVPLIRVTSLDSHTFSETIYLNNAEQVLVRPRTQSATFFIEQQHRIHSIHSGAGFGGPGHHHHNEGMENVEL